ncbi:DsrE family protein [Thiosocius teredinicola]|uniref:DsrE family protein n=1 Tax=Thiosocius teredinicola TaxID=1973002 RepID=UPI00099144A0
MTRSYAFAGLLLLSPMSVDSAQPVFPEYGDPKVVFDFFFADPRHISNGLHWIRSYMNPLLEEPYDLAPEFLDIVVVIHGTEIVTLAKHNYEKYRDSVERMRYYASLGVKFRVCGIAANDYDYDAETFYDFVDIVPSAMVEVAYWQQRGYGLVIPQMHEKRYTTDEIR